MIRIDKLEYDATFMFDGKTYRKGQQIESAVKGMEGAIIATEVESGQSVLFPLHAEASQLPVKQGNEVLVSTPCGALRAQVKGEGMEVSLVRGGVETLLFVAILDTGATNLATGERSSILEFCYSPKTTAEALTVSKEGADAMQARIDALCQKMDEHRGGQLCHGELPQCPLSAINQEICLCTRNAIMAHYDYIDQILKQHGF